MHKVARTYTHTHESCSCADVRWLTVRETLDFYAAARERRERVVCGSGRFARQRRRDRRVARVLRELELYEERHSPVGVGGDARHRGLSGGQRKRVSVAIELVADPSVLLLDEPTSGLDANTSNTVLVALRCAAARGVTVAAVLHQPSARMWRSIDDALVLAQGGKVAYAGPAQDAARHFEQLLSRGVAGSVSRRHDDSVPDFVLECVASRDFLRNCDAPLTGNAFAKRPADCASSSPDQVLAAYDAIRTPPPAEQFWLFASRAHGA